MLCVNYALPHYSIGPYKIFLHSHCFGYPELIFPFKTCFPIILFRFFETTVYWSQGSYATNVPLTFIIFFCEGKNTFPKMKTQFPLVRFIGIRKLCIVVYRKV